MGAGFDAEQLPEEENEEDTDESGQEISASGKQTEPTEETCEPQEGQGKANLAGGKGASKGETRPSPTRTKLLDGLLNKGARITEILEHMHEVETLIKQIRPITSKAGSDGVEATYEYGNELARMAPEEVALLTNKDTELDFLVKYATHQLLLRAPLERKRQPINLCLDTSGSMQGSFYNKAAGFCLAVIKFMMHERRGISLITFDSSICREVIIDAGKRVDIAALIEVLLNPSYGGTNFDTALLRSQAIRDELKWKSQATFLITDGFDHISQADRINNNKKTDRIIAVVVSNDSGNALMPVADEIKKLKHKGVYDLVDAARELF
jgi:uncharacterized protein with von Willebrand factor type A (vWA) domain